MIDTRNSYLVIYGSCISRVFFFSVLAVIFFSQSCGYALVGTGSSLPPEIRRISIPSAKNLTPEPNMDQYITEAIRSAFITDARLKVESGEEAGDATLECVIRGYRFRPLAFDQSNNVTDYQIEYDLFVTLNQVGAAKPLVKQVVATRWTYKVSAQISSAEAAKTAAIKEGAKDAAQQILTIILEGF